MRLLRPIRRATLFLLAILFAFFLFVQFQQRLLRRRAERLHGEIVALQLHPGTFADIERLQKEWGRFAHYNGECTSRHCIYQIKLEDIVQESTAKLWPLIGDLTKLTDSDWKHISKVQQWVFMAYRALGGRPAEVGANVRVHDNQMWGVAFNVMVTNFPGVGRNSGQEYVVGATTALDSRLLNIEKDYPEFLRRGYSDILELNCLGCEYVGGTFTAQTDPTYILRFNGLDLNCLGPWHVCTHPADVAPELSAQALRDSNDGPQDDEHLAQELCALPVSVLAREANDIVLVQVLSLKTHRYPESSVEYQVASAAVLKRVKNGLMAPVAGELSFVTDVEGTKELAQMSRLKVGQKYYVMYGRPHPQDVMQTPEVEPCHAIKATEQNAASIREGVALDPSTGEAWDWMNQGEPPFFP